MTHDNTRRDLLRVGGVALAGGLAGCLGGGGGGGGSPATATDEPQQQDQPQEQVDADHEIVVGPGGELVFEPAELQVEVGATVKWTWASDGHSVTLDSRPNDSKWRGTALYTHDEGYVMSNTFETAGTYEYYCNPHRAAGMSGVLVVGGETAEPTATPAGTPTATPTSGGDGGGGGVDY